MLRSLYSGVSGMSGFQTKLDVIGNNIANVSTVGFKSSRVMFSDILSQTMSGVTAPGNNGQGGVNAQQIGLGSKIAAIDTEFTPGSAETTNVATDLRIDGDGFFAVSPDTNGTTTYLTRAGNFTLDANRNLVTADGYRVLDNTGAAITIPSSITSYSISQDGQIIGKDNTGATTTVATLGIIKVENPGGLEKVGSNMYQLTANASSSQSSNNLNYLTANDSTNGTGAIISGQLEMSNVDLTKQFTEMIIAERGFQANSRIITASDQILQDIVNLVH